MAKTDYSFTKVVVVVQLESEILNSAITTALESIILNGTDALTVSFKNPLSSGDESILNALIAAHVPLVIESSVYSGTIIPLTPPATPTDIVTLFGSASKTVKVLRISLGTTQTTVGINDWYLVKRSSDNTGGASTTIAGVPFNSASKAATAVLKRYTTKPATLGTTVGNLSIVNVISPPISPGTSGTRYAQHVWDYSDNPIVLRSASEGIAINFNGAALPAGLSVNTEITWSEE